MPWLLFFKFLLLPITTFLQFFSKIIFFAHFYYIKKHHPHIIVFQLIFQFLFTYNYITKLNFV